MPRSLQDSVKQIVRSKKLIAVATRLGDLCYLNCRSDSQRTYTAAERFPETKEDVWHRQFGHLGAKNLEKLVKHKLFDGFDFDAAKEMKFCEACVDGKHHRCRFPTSGRSRSKEPLGLVHSDVCRKMSTKSLSGAEYFLTFIDDTTRMGLYPET